jgi:ketosteroid isomerase-like protein
MPQANVEIVNYVIEAFNRRDVDGILQCVNPDLEWFPAISVPFGGDPLRGREGIEAYVREITDTWEEYRVVSQDFGALGGERVLVLSRVEARGAGSHGLVDEPMGEIYDLRDGKISRVRTYLDHDEALQAAGLASQAMSEDATTPGLVELVQRFIDAFERREHRRGSEALCLGHGLGDTVTNL